MKTYSLFTACIALACASILHPIEVSAQGSGLGSNCFAVADGGRIDEIPPDGIDSTATDIFTLVNKATGEEQQLGNIGSKDVEAIAYNPNEDILYAADAGNLYQVTWQDGTNNVALTTNGNSVLGSTLIGSFGSATGALGTIVFDDMDGMTLDVRATPPILYGSLRRTGGVLNDLICQISTNDASIVPNAFGPGVDYLVVSNQVVIGGVPIQTNTLADIDDIAIDPTDSTMYAIHNRSGFRDHLVIIDLTDGSVTDIGVLNIDDAEGLAFYIDGSLFVSTGKNADNTNNWNSLFDLTTDGEAITNSQKKLNFDDYEGLSCFTETFATIGNFAWQDANKDGIQDTNEVGLAGVTVSLRKVVGTSSVTVASNVTLADGFYTIPIEPGDYYLHFEPPTTNWVPTIQNAVGDDAVDSDADPVTGDTTNTTLEVKEVDLTWDAGFICLPPVIECPDDITLDCTNNVSTNLTGTPVVSSLCGLSVSSSFSDVTVTNCGTTRTITRTWTATDAFGTSSTCTQIISVVDTNPPVIVSCPADVDLACNEEVPAPATNEVVTTDDCHDVVVTHAGDVTNSYGCSNVIIRTYTATDECDNSTNCIQVINQPVDSTPPQISCLGDTNLACNATIPEAATNTLTVSDNCTLESVYHLGDVTNSTGCVLSVTRTYVAEDACGNTNFCTRTFTVPTDTNPPSITCLGDTNLACNATIPEAATNTLTVSDNCILESVYHLGDVTNSTGCVLSVTRTYVAEDACGNTNFCTRTFTVPTDTNPPSITCLGDTNLACNATIPDPNTNTLTVSDNCILESVYHLGDVTNFTGCVLSVTRTYVAEDACGNTNFCTRIFTVPTDTEPPVIVCASNLLLDCTAEIPAADTNALVEVSDNCELKQVFHVRDITNATACTTTVTRTYRAVDACGNSNDCTRVITLVDTNPPVITCATDFTITANVACVTNVPDIRPTATDDCQSTNILVTQVPLPGTQVVGPTTVVVTVTATDICGNSTNCQTEITIVCTEPSAIGDYVWEDVNLNGVQNTNEVGVSNVVVELLDSTNGVVTSTLTDTNGFYLFGNLEAGTYSVRFTAPSNALYTLTNAGPDDVDSDADATSLGQTPQVTLAIGETNDTLDAGLIFPEASVSIDKTVYIGHNDGADCPGVEVVTSTNQQPVTYCLVVTNTGNTYLSMVTVTDDDLSPAYSNLTALLPPGGVTNMHIDSSINETLTNTAYVVGTPSFSNGTPIATLTNVTDNDPAEVREIDGRIEIRKTVIRGHFQGSSSGCPGLESLVVTNGAEVSYCIEIENIGSTYLGRIVVTDGSLSFTTNVTLLAPGEITNILIETEAFGELVNTACVSSTVLDEFQQPITNSVPIEDCDTAEVLAIPGGIILEKTVYLGHAGNAGCSGATEVVTGEINDPITYCFRIINPADSQSKVNLVLKDPSLSYLKFPANMAAGTERLFSLAKNITGDFENTAEVIGKPADENFVPYLDLPSTHDTDQAYVNVEDTILNIEKTVSLDGSCPGSDSLVAAPGTNITYCFIISNGGTETLSSVTLKDADVTPAINQLVNGGSLLAGQSVTVSVAQVMGSNQVINTAIVAAKTPGNQTVIDSDTATATPSTTLYTLNYDVVQGNGSVDVPEGSYLINSLLVLTALPAPLYTFQAWQGDVSSSNITINVLMDGDKNLELYFKEILGTNCVPLVWLQDNNLATNDTALLSDGDVDGALAWEEYFMGTDPNVTTSVLQIVEEYYDDGVPEMVILWSSETGRSYDVLRASTLTPENFTAIAAGISATPPINSYTNAVTDSDLYYIYKVELTDPSPDCN